MPSLPLVRSGPLLALTWAHPELLWGLAAVTVPVVVHLLLRARPRRVRFPALVLMRPALTAGQRANRMRNLLLLITRAAVLALAALALAAPSCVSQTSPGRGTAARAAVLLLDDSLSTRVRQRYDQPETVLDDLQGRALQMVEDAAGWAPGSQLTVLRASDAVPLVGPTSDWGAVRRALSTAPARTPSGRPLGAGIQAAARALRESSGSKVPLLVVLTDGTAAAWRDVRPSMFADIPGLRLRVLVRSAEESSDVGIVSAAGPGTMQPAGVPASLRVELRTSTADGRARLVVRRGEAVLARVDPVEFSAQRQREMWLAIPASERGPTAVTIEVQPDDSFVYDQQRFAAWEVGERPVGWLVTAPGRGPDQDLTVLLLRNLLAPETLAAEQHRVDLRIMTTADLENSRPDATGSAPAAASGQSAAGSPSAGPALIVLLPYDRAAPQVIAALRERVESGATLVLVPGSETGGVDWPGLRDLLATQAPVLDVPEDGAYLRAAAQTDAADAVLSADARRELAVARVQRRLHFTRLLAGVRRSATFTDDVPAILWSPLGRGRLVALTTSPDPAWSDWGIRAAGLLRWLHGLAEDARGPAAAVAELLAGEESRTRLEALGSGLYQVRGTETTSQVSWIRVNAGTPEEPWPAFVPGIYSVQTARGEPRAMYVVNWPSEELDRTPLVVDELIRAMGEVDTTVEAAGGPTTAAPSGVWRWLADPRLSAPLGTALVVGLLLEMALSLRRARAAAA